jgi:16S rRNA (cytosine1402-N4)-methyltransferase
MDPESGESAAQLIDQLDLDGLTKILREFGEEPRARRIARAIIEGRPWSDTVSFAGAVAEASGYRNSRVHPATRTFQALRIAVNDELGQLQRGLDAAVDLLAPKGRLAVISFHSLEDRRVKQRFRALAGVGTPRDEYGNPKTPPLLRLVTRKPIRGADMDKSNPRSRSASLRIAERLD